MQVYTFVYVKHDAYIVKRRIVILIMDNRIKLYA